MKHHENYVAQQSFIELCSILKAQEGLYYCEIAQQMNVETSMFCRWLHDSVHLPESHNRMLAGYFSNKAYAKYKHLFVAKMRSALDLAGDSCVLFIMRNMSYASLIDYMFCELKIEDLDKQRHINEIVIEVVKSSVSRKMMMHRLSVEFCSLDQLVNNYKRVNAVITVDPSIEKNIFIIKICRQAKMNMYIAVYLIPNENMDSKTDYISIAQKVVKFRRIVNIRQLVFLRMPKLESPESVGSAMERYGDLVSRKIIRIIENSARLK